MNELIRARGGAVTAEYPLVLSMTNFQHFMRCRKMFELETLRELNPRRDSQSAAAGRVFHALMAYAAEHDGMLPPDDGDDMWDVAETYLATRPLPRQIVSAERGYFAEVGPNVFIRASFDLVYLDEDGTLCVRDYKTFSKMPSLDADLDFQARAYLVVAEISLGAIRARFEWENVRNELGRFLTRDKKQVWASWEEHERYDQQHLELTENERETTLRELYDCSLDIRGAIETGRFYRYSHKWGGTCSDCFVRDLCKAEYLQGALDEQTIALLTEPYDPAARVHPSTMLNDPRVTWYVLKQGKSRAEAVEAVYGAEGLAKIETMEKAA